MSEYTGNGEDNGTEENNGGDKPSDLKDIIQPLIYLIVGAAIVLGTIFFITGCSLDNPFVKDAEQLIEHYHDGTLHAHEDGDEPHTHSEDGVNSEPVERGSGLGE